MQTIHYAEMLHGVFVATHPQRISYLFKPWDAHYGKDVYCMYMSHLYGDQVIHMKLRVNNVTGLVVVCGHE